MSKGWKPWKNARADSRGRLIKESGTDSPLPSKMGNIITIVDGIRYHSKIEGRYAANLNLLVKAGAVKFYLRQVGFDIIGARHFVDFLIFYPDGTWKFVEAKGRDLAMGKLKRRQVEEIYGIRIEVVK